MMINVRVGTAQKNVQHQACFCRKPELAFSFFRCLSVGLGIQVLHWIVFAAAGPDLNIGELFG